MLLAQGLFAWALWSLRRAFVRTDEYLLHLQRDARREAATARRLSLLEEQWRQSPDNTELSNLRAELADLRGEIQALNVRISGLDRLLERLEHGLDRQEDRLRHIPAGLGAGLVGVGLGAVAAPQTGGAR